MIIYQVKAQVQRIYGFTPDMLSKFFYNRCNLNQMIQSDCFVINAADPHPSSPLALSGAGTNPQMAAVNQQPSIPSYGVIRATPSPACADLKMAAPNETPAPSDMNYYRYGFSNPIHHQPALIGRPPNRSRATITSASSPTAAAVDHSLLSRMGAVSGNPFGWRDTACLSGLLSMTPAFGGTPDYYEGPRLPAAPAFLSDPGGTPDCYEGPRLPAAPAFLSDPHALTTTVSAGRTITTGNLPVIRTKPNPRHLCHHQGPQDSAAGACLPHQQSVLCPSLPINPEPCATPAAAPHCPSPPINPEPCPPPAAAAHYELSRKRTSSLLPELHVLVETTLAGTSWSGDFGCDDDDDDFLSCTPLSARMVNQFVDGAFLEETQTPGDGGDDNHCLISPAGIRGSSDALDHQLLAYVSDFLLDEDMPSGDWSFVLGN